MKTKNEVTPYQEPKHVTKSDPCCGGSQACLPTCCEDSQMCCV